MAIEVAVLIVSYNSRDDLAVCLPSVLASHERELAVRVVVVDCASSDGSADYVARMFPAVDLVRSSENLGYAGGNNLGLAHVRAHYPAAQYLAVLNPDTRVRSGWLSAMIDLMRQNDDIAVVQAKLLLMDAADRSAVSSRSNRIDSAGNQSHVLGFGFVTAYNAPDDGRFDQVRNLPYASGAAMLVRLEALGGDDLFDDAYFMYLEDAELGWRMRLAGHRLMYQPAAVVHHRHDPGKTIHQLYDLERNRWRLLLTAYQWRTLLLLSPMAVLIELMVLVYALGNGKLASKLRAMGAVLRSLTDGSLLRRRRQIQTRRRLTDRLLLAGHTPLLDATAVRRNGLRAAINLVLRLIWSITYVLIRW